MNTKFQRSNKFNCWGSFLFSICWTPLLNYPQSSKSFFLVWLFWAYYYFSFGSSPNKSQTYFFSLSFTGLIVLRVFTVGDWSWLPDPKPCILDYKYLCSLFWISFAFFSYQSWINSSAAYLTSFQYFSSFGFTLPNSIAYLTSSITFKISFGS